MNRRTLLFLGGSACVVSLAGCANIFDDNTEGESDSEPDIDIGPEPSEEIVQQYRRGLTGLRGGEAGIQVGNSDFNLEDFESAVESFADAEVSFDNAEERFSEAVSLTFEAEAPDAREICENAQSHAVDMGAAAEQMRLASEAAADGNTDCANSYINSAVEFENDAEQNPPEDLSTLEAVLE